MAQTFIGPIAVSVPVGISGTTGAGVTSAPGHIRTKYSWKRKFAFLPRLCNISKKLIWLKYAYKGIKRTYYDTLDLSAITIGGSHTIKWHDEKHHLVWILTQDADD